MRRKGHCLKQIIDSGSRGQGEPDAFIFLITFEICWYVGGSRLNGITGSDKVGIQLGRLKTLVGFTDERVLAK